jgi:hypothetical protein
MTDQPNIVLVYAEGDNNPGEGDPKGWVSNFHKFFSSLFLQVSGIDPVISMKSEATLQPSDVEEADAVLFVLTPISLQENKLVNTISGWVQMSEFGKVSDRLFIIHKTEVNYSDELPELADIISYDLFFIDPLTGTAQEFRRFFGQDAERGYWMKLIDLAYDLFNLLNPDEKLKNTEKEKTDPAKTVYLANTGVDLIIHRDIIKRELKRHGYHVLPSQTLPKERDKLDTMIREDLARCSLSIHLIGEDYGYKVKGSDRSVVDMQNQLASDQLDIIKKYNESAKKPKKFSRLIWITPELKNVSERQKIFIDDIKGEAAGVDEAEVLQVTLNEFKAIIREELETGGRFKSKARMEREDALNGSSKSIYIIHDKSDAKSITKLKNYFDKKGFEVLSPAFEGDVMDIRFVHESNLRKCDGSIIFYGDTSEEWIKTKLQDLLKAPGFGRSKPDMAKALIITGEKNIDKNSLDKYKTLVVEEAEKISAKDLQPFIAKLESL